MAAQAKPRWQEGILAKSGMIITCGSVERGTTVCDSDPLEKAVPALLGEQPAHTSKPIKKMGLKSAFI